MSLRIEVAFNAGFTTPEAERVWTDLSGRAEGQEQLTITRGRGDEHSEVDASTLSLTLDNTDGALTPENTIGAYYPSVKKGRPIRVTRLGDVDNALADPFFDDGLTGWSVADPVTNSLSRRAGGVAPTAYYLRTHPLTDGSGSILGPSVTVPAGATVTVVVWARNGAWDVRLATDPEGFGLTVGSISPTAEWQEFRVSAVNSGSTFTRPLAFRDTHAGAVDADIAAILVHVGDAAFQGSWLSHRFLGYVDSWPVEWPEGGDERSTVTISATSRQSRLTKGAQMKSIIEEQVLPLSPAAYYTLGDEQDSTSALDSSGNGQHARLAGSSTDGTTVVFGNATGPGTDGMTAAEFHGGQYLTRTSATAFTGAQVTLTCFLNITAATGNEGVLTLAEAGFARYVEIVYTWSPVDRVHLKVWDGTTLSEMSTLSFDDIDDGGTHFLAATLDLATGLVTFVQDDNFPTTAATGVMLPGFAPTILRLGYARNDGAGSEAFLDGVLAHVGVFASVLTADEIAAIGEAGLSAGDGETPGERIARLAALAHVAADEVDADDGATAALVNQHTEDSTPLDLMQAVALTEGGLLFDGRDGHLVFHGRDRRFNALSEFTLDAGADEVDAALAPLYDDFGMVNDSTVTGSGVAGRAIDTASADEYGEYRDDFDALLDDADEVQSLAAWRVSKYAEPRVRIPNVATDVSLLDASLQATLLAADLDSRFTLTGLPEQAPAFSLDLIIEGYTETITYDAHVIKFNTSRADIYEAWVLDDSIHTYADHSILGRSTALAY